MLDEINWWMEEDFRPRFQIGHWAKRLVDWNKIGLHARGGMRAQQEFGWRCKFRSKFADTFDF